jgi:hypothetical protein
VHVTDGGLLELLLRAHPKITESRVCHFVDAGFPRWGWAS